MTQCSCFRRMHSMTHCSCFRRMHSMTHCSCLRRMQSMTRVPFRIALVLPPLTFDGCSIAIGILPFPCSFPPLHRPIDAVRSGSIDRVHDDSSDDTYSIPSSRRYANHKEYLWYLCYHVNRNGVPPLLSEVRSRDDDASSHTDPVSSQLRSHDGRAPSENCSNEDDYSTWGMWFTFFILYCNFIPISLYVTIEIVNYGQVASVGARRAAPHCSFGWFVERTARVVPQCWWCGLRLLLGAVHCFFCVVCGGPRHARGGCCCGRRV